MVSCLYCGDGWFCVRVMVPDGKCRQRRHWGRYISFFGTIWSTLPEMLPALSTVNSFIYLFKTSWLNSSNMLRSVLGTGDTKMNRLVMAHLGCRLHLESLKHKPLYTHLCEGFSCRLFWIWKTYLGCGWYLLGGIPVKSTWKMETLLLACLLSPSPANSSTLLLRPPFLLDSHKDRMLAIL